MCLQRARKVAEAITTLHCVLPSHRCRIQKYDIHLPTHTARKWFTKPSKMILSLLIFPPFLMQHQWVLVWDNLQIVMPSGTERSSKKGMWSWWRALKKRGRVLTVSQKKIRTKNCFKLLKKYIKFFHSRKTGLRWLILCVNLTGLKDAQLAGNTLFLGVSVRGFCKR